MRIFISLLYMLTVIGYGWAQVLPSDDTYVRGGTSAGINYGSDPDLVIKRGTVESFFRKTLLKFDLRGMSGISAEDSVFVKLYVSSMDAAYPVTVYEISDNWDEASVTWSSAPISGNILGTMNITDADTYYNFDLTTYFRAQMSAGDSLLSIALFDENSNNQKIAFNSKEAGVNLPLLVVSGNSGVSLDLAQVLINGVAMAEFDNLVREYPVDLPYTTTAVPTLKVTPINGEVRVDIQKATSLTGEVDARTARITVQSPDSTEQRIYSLIFNVLPKLDLFLLIGQSNMAGRADIEAQDEEMVARCLLAKTDNQWDPAQNPLNKYSNIRKELSIQKLGPGYTFSRTLVDSLADTNLGLVVNALGGSSISSWLKGSSDGYYEKTFSRLQPAMRYGTLKAILWLQGSSDQSNYTTYMAKLKKLVADLRSDIGKADLYFVASQLGKWRSNSENINMIFTQIPDSIAHADYIISDGLTPLNGDTTDPHFDSRSQRILGERYAQKILDAVYSGQLSLQQKSNSPVPEQFILFQNFPNPFNPQTTISYNLQKPARVQLAVFDMSGKINEILVNTRQGAGLHKVNWKPDQQSTGIYFYQLIVDDMRMVRKMLLIK